ncbi:MAG: molybdenum cofactor biosynthesis protein MoaE [Methanocorpusculum sp.]|uniref:molybdenum cofactor biosynthesis protein MoaE n=1 Tax=Methanocorpusculum sp. TaxID=2058474 RepID=UPI00271A806C|nr:molybdenum cofactor biosynthesis protein MoaE [Methanocorpusculum sp.]MDO9523624.1 molybdenum cofactor biosynthesis protein MoaE [Methanocorpusculum sp.]
MVLALQKEDIDIGALISASRTNNDGAQIVFVGCVRDDGNMDALEIEAFVPVAEKDLAYIAEEATNKFGLNSVDIIHRYGRLALGETIVVILVGAGHRPEAYEGSRFIIERLKEKVPIWKQELSGNARGEWVH